MIREEQRRSKYPETDTFHYHNANPKNRITTDCIVRVISTATEIPYNKVVMELAEMQCSTGYDYGDAALIDKYLTSKGFTKNKQPRKEDNTKYTGKEFCYLIQERLKNPFRINRLGRIKRLSRIVANIGGHHIVAIIDGKVNDIWNSTGGCIGNFWSHR